MKKSKVYYFNLGRNGMYASLKLMNIKPGDEILTPAWDCDGALQPFREMECKLIFYRIDAITFEIDFDHLETLLTKKTKLIHVINYFGFKQPWGKIDDLKKRKKIIVLEDNAYSLPSFIIDQNLLGSHGDFSIFSLRKIFNLPNGALLVDNRANAPDFSFKRNLHITNFKEIKKTAGIVISKILSLPKLRHSKVFRLYSKSKTVVDYWFPLYSENDVDIPFGERNIKGTEFYKNPMMSMSLLVKFMFFFFRPNKIRAISKKRRALYEYLVSQLEGINHITVLHKNLAKYESPFSVCFLVHKDRDTLLITLLRKRYPVWVWPSLPQEVLDNLIDFPEIKVLGKQLLQINLKEQLKLQTYRNMINDIEEFVWSS
jgi:dTDP-4-amino-4,6-dideoxygalactose transaminase